MIKMERTEMEWIAMITMKNNAVDCSEQTTKLIYSLVLTGYHLRGSSTSLSAKPAVTGMTLKLCARSCSHSYTS